MASNRKKKIRTVVELMLSLVFFILAVHYIQRHNLKDDLRLLFQVRVTEPVVFELIINDKSLKSRIDPGSDFQYVDFKLPKDEIQTVRLGLGNRAICLAIRQVKLKTLFKTYDWQNLSLPKLFDFKHNIRKAFTEKGIFMVETEGEGAILGLARSFSVIINKVAARKLTWYLLVFILSGFLFLLIHFFDPKNLRKLFPPRVYSVRVLVFLLLIFFPLLNSVFKVVKPIDIQERRALQKKPRFRLDSLGSFPDKYQRYYKDHFVLRNWFIRLNNLMVFKLFSKSAVPMVLIGKNGWLFLSRETDQRDEKEYFRAIRPFTNSELKHWNHILEQRRLWLERQGIKYLFVIVPNKSTIYPEFMPDNIRQVHNRSRLDQLLDYTRVYSKVRILDLRSALKKAKDRYPVFYKTDSHWNDFGAYVAYTEIMKYLNIYHKDETPMPLSRFEIRIKNWAGGDLAGALSLEKEVLREDILEMVPKIPFQARIVFREDISPYITRSVSVSPTGKLPLAMMVHDSFIRELRPFLAEHFSRMVFIWDWGLKIYPRLIRAEKPWIVIEEMNERYLLDKVLSNPEAISASGRPDPDS